MFHKSTVIGVREIRIEHDVVGRDIRQIRADVNAGDTRGGALEDVPFSIAIEAAETGEGNVEVPIILGPPCTIVG